MSAEVRVLEVRLGEDLVGHLSRCGQVHRFAAAPAWVSNPERPTLSVCLLGANEAETRQRLLSDSGPHVLGVGRLPPFFRNLLPEGPLRTRLLGSRATGVDLEFDMLAVAGRNLPGAVSLTPSAAVPSAVLEWHERHSRGGLVPVSVAPPSPNAFSLAGSTDKHLFVERHETAAGAVEEQHWFAKLGPESLAGPSDRARRIVAENEYAATRLAAAAGVATVDVRLVELAALGLNGGRPGARALLVRRFDRAGAVRIHCEDFAQILERDPEDRYGHGENYETIARILGELAHERVDTVLELVRRLVVDVLLGNTTRHLKNLAVMYPGRRIPVLAPSFDTVATALAAGHDRLALPLAGEREMSRVTIATFTDFAGAAGLAPKAVQRCVRNTVRRALTDWPGLLAQSPLDATTREYVLSRLARLPLVTGGESRLAAA